MSEQQLTIEETFKNKVFKESQLWVVSYLGGPLGASYLLSHNFKIFGEHKKAKIIWTGSIIFTIFLSIFLILIPEAVIEKIPKVLIPVIYSGAYYGIMHYYQSEKINDYINAGGIFEGWGKSISISIIGCIIFFLSMFIFAVLVDFLTPMFYLY